MSGGATQEPVRMCMICRRRFAKSRLLRHVAGFVDDGPIMLTADEAQTKPGRGWYICDDRQCREKLTKAGPKMLGQARRKRKGNNYGR